MKQYVDKEQFSHAIYDLVYDNKSQSQKLDIVYPEIGDGPFPLLIFFHGGGFVGGSKNCFTISFIFKLIARGYAVASVDYRSALEAPWPAQILDAKAAVRYLKANADKLNVKTDCVAVAGCSAGATIAQLVAATGGKPIFEDLSTGNENFSSKVDVLISFYGLSSFVQDAIGGGMPIDLFCKVNMISKEELIKVFNAEYLCATDVLLRKKSSEDLDFVETMNPINYVDETFPYALLQHGTKDPVICYKQSEQMADMIRQKCGSERVQLDIFPDAVHGDIVFKCNENMERCISFLQTYMPSNQIDLCPLPEIKIVSVEE